MTWFTKRDHSGLRGNHHDPADGSSSDGALLDFVGRVGRLCADFSEHTGIECRWDISPQPGRIDPFVGEVLYAAIEELLGNVRRHSGARRVDVESTMQDDGSIVLRVKDDGTGFAQPLPEQPAGGLRLIEQRLRDIGAYLAFRNDPGACVTIVLPGWLVVVP